MIPICIEIEAAINTKRKEIIFPVANKNFLPQYLKYLFEYHHIPFTYKIIFTDKTFENIEDFILKGDHK